MEKYVCAKTRVFYFESLITAFYPVKRKDIVIFDFKCISMHWNNMKLRTMYQMSIGDLHTEGKKFDTGDPSLAGVDFTAATANNDPAYSQGGIKTTMISFNKGNNFDQ
jgi:hypothetical protein